MTTSFTITHRDGPPSMEEALKAVLLFYHAGPWTNAVSCEWWNLTQTEEATTRNLCDTVRAAIDPERRS